MATHNTGLAVSDVGSIGLRSTLRNPLLLRTNLVFALLATLGFGLVILAVRNGVIPWVPEGERLTFFKLLPGWGSLAFKAWVRSSPVVAMLVPLLVLLVWGRRRVVRTVFGPYLGMTVVHGVSEFALVLLLDYINPLVGLTYSAYRVYQLGYGYRVFQAAEFPGRIGRGILGGVLLFGLGFWSINIVLLLTIIAIQVVYGPLVYV